MSLHKVFSTLAVAAALVGTGLGTASAAQAAEKSTVIAAAPVNAKATTSAAAGYVYYDWYWTRANCNAAGTVLKNAGETTKFYCQNSGLVVDLYIWK
ncbi:hypothetical protein SHKM778_45600 [Streptomyces sp. KM77-8]|uniref:Uncharacterized protein n=1 Tax=Streptomyces haneummycinicus TaxID=3074435 RepID=A0AAT9HKV8_9ACTN